MVTRFKCLKLYVNKRSNVANLLGINPLKTDVFELKNTNSKSIHRLLLTPNRLLPNGKCRTNVIYHPKICSWGIIMWQEAFSEFFWGVCRVTVQVNFSKLSTKQTK
jgi:hypothetical protein